MAVNGFVCLAGDPLQETGGAGDGGCYEKSGQVCHRRVKRTGPHALQTGQSGCCSLHHHHHPGFCLSISCLSSAVTADLSEVPDGLSTGQETQETF